MARRIGAYKFMECSAKNREGVDEVFSSAAKAALLMKNGPARTKRIVPVEEEGVGPDQDALDAALCKVRTFPVE